MSRRFVIDMSDLYDFLGQDSGIGGVQRFLLNVAANASVWKHDEVVLAHWHPVLRRYVEFPLEDPSLPFHTLRARSGYPRIASYGPHKYAGRPFARMLYRNRRRLNRFWQLEVRGAIARAATRGQPRPVELGEGDVLLSMGSGWDESVVAMLEHVRPLVREKGVVPVVLVHDLIPFHEGVEIHPAWKVAGFKRWLDHVTSFVDRYLVYSRSSENDLAAHFKKRGLAGKEIRRFPLAHELSLSGMSEGAELSDEVVSVAARPFVLFVGPIKGRKNGARLVEVWKRIRDERGIESLPDLVFAGSGRMRDLPAEIDEKLAARIKLIRYPSDHELSHLYLNARFCVFPSLFEGWGLPIGEALWHRKLCVTSDTSSMPEVGGEWADYFDPYDVESMRSAIEKPLFDSGYLAKREAEIKHAPLHDWQTSIHLLFEAAASLANRSL